MCSGFKFGEKNPSGKFSMLSLIIWNLRIFFIQNRLPKITLLRYGLDRLYQRNYQI